MTAKPGNQPIYIYRGDPWSMTLSSEVGGVPETVVAGDALAQIRVSENATPALVDLSVAVAGGTQVTLSLTAAQTAALASGTYVWDFQPSATAETWLRGLVTVQGDVSRDAA